MRPRPRVNDLPRARAAGCGCQGPPSRFRLGRPTRREGGSGATMRRLPPGLTQGDEGQPCRPSRDTHAGDLLRDQHIHRARVYTNEHAHTCNTHVHQHVHTPAHTSTPARTCHGGPAPAGGGLCSAGPRPPACLWTRLQLVASRVTGADKAVTQARGGRLPVSLSSLAPRLAEGWPPESRRVIESRPGG